jgi:5' nucleotidase, deoxy (Pyrimidine), cytosolic type C protein (NT5C)
VKFFELANNHQSRPIVFVDMDGVLADFFGQVAKEHGVSYWREIHRKQLGIDQIAQQPNFFATLPPMPNAAKLMAGVIAIAGTYSILSSPLLSSVERSTKEKEIWLKKHIKQNHPDTVIFDSEKYKFARQEDGTPNILIDDWDTNIKLWESHGGIGILHTDETYSTTLQQLQLALEGRVEPHEIDDREFPVDHQASKLFTRSQVLKYVKGIHKDYSLDAPITKYKVWKLEYIPVSSLKNPEFIHQDDPYRRVIDVNWDHINSFSLHNVNKKPIIIDDNGWILDGNHRAMAARAHGVEFILALHPVVPA